MFEYLLRDKPQPATRQNFIPGFYQRGKIPFRFIGKCLQIHPAFKEKPAFFRQGGKGILQPVENLAQQARPQFHGKKIVAELHLLPDAQPAVFS